MRTFVALMISTATKTDIRSLSLDKLTELFTSMGEKAFRARQVHEWLWKKSARSFSEMTNLSLDLRGKLEENFSINAVVIESSQRSNDGTIKCALKLFDGNVVEAVLIPTPDRMTACVSSQVGCSLSCKFCATGYLERKRNLEAAEIYDEVVLIKQLAEKEYNQPLTNIVYMGMGEPLLNYANVMRSIEMITSPEGLGMSPQRITVSTAGVAKMIRKLGDEEVRFNLALSLHAANDEKRSQIMGINDSNNLDVLKDALAHFYDKTGTRITLEYIVFSHFNDELADAEELYRFSRCAPTKVNLIEYNPISNASFLNTSDEKLDNFRDYLEGRGLIVNVRRSRGKDIDAACGQLANKH